MIWSDFYATEAVAESEVWEQSNWDWKLGCVCGAERWLGLISEVLSVTVEQLVKTV